MTTILHHHLDNARIAYAWSHGPTQQPLVVLHGLGDSAIHTYAPRFADSRLGGMPSLFIDLPGFGEGIADAPYPASMERMTTDVGMLLKSLSIENAPVFAHSMGANLAIMLASAWPGLVSRLILAEPLLDEEQSIMAASIARRTEDDFVSRGFPMLVRATTLQAQRGELAAEAFLPVLKMANPAVMHRTAVSLLWDRKPAFSEMLVSLQQPATLLSGSNSNAAAPQLVREAIPEIEIRDAGHFMVVEQTELTICAILNLVN